jgi:hypothetical protein
MALRDLLLYNYRPERILNDSFFEAGDGIYYDVDKKSVEGTSGYSDKNKRNYSIARSINHGVRAVLFASLLSVSLIGGVKYDKINEGHIGKLVGAGLYIPFLLGAGRNVEGAKLWYLVSKEYSD